MTTDVFVRDFSVEVAEVTAEIEQQRTLQIKVEAEKQSAQRDYNKAIAQLNEDFGVETLEEAQHLLVELDTQLEHELSSIRESLARAGENNGSSG